MPQAVRLSKNKHEIVSRGRARGLCWDSTKRYDLVEGRIIDGRMEEYVKPYFAGAEPIRQRRSDSLEKLDGHKINLIKA